MVVLFIAMTTQLITHQLKNVVENYYLVIFLEYLNLNIFFKKIFLNSYIEIFFYTKITKIFLRILMLITKKRELVPGINVLN